MAEANQQEVAIRTVDGFSLAATLFTPSNTKPDRALIIGSALGVPRYFYYKLARFFAQNGYMVLTFDYRGIYESRSSTFSGSDIKMEHWGSHDIEAALRYALKDLGINDLSYLGHSCGGQLIGLAPSCLQLNRMVFVACQQGNWKLWPKPYNIGIYLTWQLLAVSAPFFDYVPTKILGISSLNLPAGVAKQWAEWGKSLGYLFDSRHGLNTSRYPRLEIPLLAYHLMMTQCWGRPRRSRHC